MTDSKTIKVNPEYFSLNGKKNKTNKTREKKKKVKQFSQHAKPGKARKELLRRIKEHQRKQRELSKKQNDETIKEFKDELATSMDYLQNVIKDNQKKKRDRKSRKNKDYQKPQLTMKPSISSFSLQPNTTLEKNQEKLQSIDTIQVEPLKIKTDVVKHSPRLVDVSNDIKVDVNKEIPIEIDVEPINVKPLMSKETPMLEQSNIARDENNLNIKTWSTSDKKEPKYGCLKNGNKPTYKQYIGTLKKKEITGSLPKLSVEMPKVKHNIERKNKLQSLIQKSETTKHNNKPKSGHKYKKYNLRKIHKTYKIGKHKDKKTVGILLKNNNTRKKVMYEMNTLKKTPMPKVKAFLREKHLLKLGSKVPDSIARETFLNCILSGDVISKNYDVMVYNYLH